MRFVARSTRDVGNVTVGSEAPDCEAKCYRWPFKELVQAGDLLCAQALRPVDCALLGAPAHPRFRVWHVDGRERDLLSISFLLHKTRPFSHPVNKAGSAYASAGAVCHTTHRILYSWPGSVGSSSADKAKSMGVDNSKLGTN